MSLLPDITRDMEKAGELMASICYDIQIAQAIGSAEDFESIIQSLHGNTQAIAIQYSTGVVTSAGAIYLAMEGAKV